MIKQDGIDYILVGDETYSATSVVGVIDSLDQSSLDESVLQSANIIGKAVTAEYQDENEELITLAGIVEKIIVREGIIYAAIDGQEVRLSDITEISEQETLTI